MHNDYWKIEILKTPFNKDIAVKGWVLCNILLKKEALIDPPI
jgi:hypothetical protein